MLDDVNEIIVAKLTVLIDFQNVPEVWAKLSPYPVDEDQKGIVGNPTHLEANTMVTLGKNDTNDQRSAKITPIVEAIVDLIGIDRRLITKLEAIASW